MRLSRLFCICNGFQILTEAGLLPGALVKNESRRFNDDWVDLEVQNPHGYFGKSLKGTVKLPVAHGDGRYYAPADELKRLHDKGQVWLKYKQNPNGSLMDIAGVFNERGNVAALMPHPERALYGWMGGTDGWSFL